MNGQTTTGRAVEVALHSMSLEGVPPSKTELSEAQFRQILQVARRYLVRRAVPYSDDQIRREIRRRGYWYLFVVPGIKATPPITMRQTVGDVLTAILARHGLPASQVSTTVLPIYGEVLTEVYVRVIARGYIASRVVIAEELQSRNYIPSPGRRRRFEAAVPMYWRRTVPGRRRTRIAGARGIESEPIAARRIQTGGTIVRGDR